MGRGCALLLVEDVLLVETIVFSYFTAFKAQLTLISKYFHTQYGLKWLQEWPKEMASNKSHCFHYKESLPLNGTDFTKRTISTKMDSFH